MINITSELAVSLSAFFVALLALFVSIWQGILTRRHNRLSVRPHLTVEVRRNEGAILEYALINNGLGPAIIKKYSVFLDGSECSASETPFQDAIDQLEFKSLGYTYFTPHPMEAMGIKDKYPLFQVIENELQKDDKILLKSLGSRITIKIEYQSIYGVNFQYQY